MRGLSNLLESTTKALPLLASAWTARNQPQALIQYMELCRVASKVTAFEQDIQSLTGKPHQKIRLRLLLRTFGEEVFPAYLETVTVEQRPVPVLTRRWAHILIVAAALCCSLIGVNDSSSLDAQTVCPRLLTAVAQLARWLTFSVGFASIDEPDMMRALQLVGSILRSSTASGPLVRPPPLNSVVDDLYLMSCAVAEVVLQEQPVVPGVTTSMLMLVAMGGLMFHARDLCMALDHTPPKTVSLLHDLVRFSVVTASRSTADKLCHDSLHTVNHLLEVFCSIDTAACVTRQGYVGVTLTRFVQSIHQCSQAYPALSQVLHGLLMKSHHHSLATQAPDALLACRITLDLCMRRTQSWMQRKVHGSLQQCRRSDLTTVTGIIIETKILNGTYFNRGCLSFAGNDACNDQLMDEYTSTAFLNGLEALLRGVDPQQGAVGCIHAACWVISAALAKPDCAPQSRAIFSLFTTLRKISAGAAASFTQSTVLGLILVYDTLQTTKAPSRERFRLQVITKLCLQPLFVLLETNGDPLWRDLSHRSAGSLPVVPDCVSEPRRWSECAQTYTRLYPEQGRLLSGCSSPWCTNLSGLLDHLLPTMLCSGCRRVRYCGRACQRHDWITGGHSGACGKECVS